MTTTAADLGLSDFAHWPPEPVGPSEAIMVPLSSDEFPEPGLLFYLLSELVGLPRYGPYEKMRVGVRGKFRSALFALEWAKFGLRLHVATTHEEHANIKGEICAKLKKAVALAQPLFADLARTSVLRGDVTIENEWTKFDWGYRIMKIEAGAAYDSAPRPVDVYEDEFGLSAASSPFIGQIRGSVFATAMIHEYFSRSEHEMLLMLAFTDFDPASGALEKFVNATWGEKFRTIFDITADAKAQFQYNALEQIRRRYRNPLAHGGMDPGSQSFFFHMGDFGAVSTRLSRAEPRRFPDLRLTHQQYVDVVRVFDEFDEFLVNHPITSFGIRFARAGLDVAFSEVARRQYRSSTTTETDFEAFVDRQHYLADQHANMDY